MTDADELLDKLKMEQANRYQDEMAYNSWYYDREWLFARMPRTLAKVLADKTEPGCVYYGWVDIFNTSLIFACRTFNYHIEEDIIESANEYGGDTVEFTCEIDYESIRESRFAIQIQEFNDARYANRAFWLIDEITTGLREQINS